MSNSDESPSALFQRTLKVTPTLADRLANAGMTALEEVAYVPFTELEAASGLTPNEVRDLRRIARLYLFDAELGDFNP